MKYGNRIKNGDRGQLDCTVSILGAVPAGPSGPMVGIAMIDSTNLQYNTWLGVAIIPALVLDCLVFGVEYIAGELVFITILSGFSGRKFTTCVKPSSCSKSTSTVHPNQCTCTQKISKTYFSVKCKRSLLHDFRVSRLAPTAS